MFIPRRTRSLVSLATAYAKQPEDDSFDIPEDLTVLSDEDLETLATQANGHFDALYADGTGFTDEDLATLAMLTDGIEAMATESARRTTLADERNAAAAALAARVNPQVAELAAETGEDGAPEPELDADGNPIVAEEEAAPEEAAAQTITASADRDKGIRVPLSSVARRAKSNPASRTPQPFSVHPKVMRDVVFSSDAPGYAAGEGMDYADLGLAIDKRIGSFNAALYDSANERGQTMREQGGIAVLRKPFEKELTIQSSDPDHIEQVMKYAVDESRLPQGSLVASGGWCAPSEVLYDIVETESRDGLLSLPEINVARGGIMFTTGPTFADIYSKVGFAFTELDDKASPPKYKAGTNPGDPNVVGAKPCYHVECPTFQEVRLEVDGVCITAGLLQQRGYPEMIARTVRGALVAHDHKMSAKLIGSLVAGSTAVSLATPQVGTTAPILSAVELQVEHYRYTHRLRRNTTLEAVFPYWVHGAIRSDLSRRLGVNLIDVTDAQIDGWFRARGISPQFVYDWQALDTTAAGAFVAWPTTVKFLLYSAGTWVRGSSDIITLDTIYDSVNLGQNDYIALFTEEGFFAAKRGHDSRVVTVPISSTGHTAAGVAIKNDGTLGP